MLFQFKSLLFSPGLTPSLLLFFVGVTSSINYSFASDDGAVSGTVKYEECMAAIDLDAERAFDLALEWRTLGGGNPARHCAAAALMALGHYKDAAKRLEYLAQQPTDEVRLRTSLLQQSAQSWSLAGDNEHAYATLTAAINIDDTDPKLFLERGAVQANMKLYVRAVDDLSRCLALDPVSVDAYTFRASAYRYLDRLDLAITDLNHALALEPNHIEALLERGIVKRLSGDKSGARQDWTTLLGIDPNSAVSEIARHNIQLLEINSN